MRTEWMLGISVVSLALGSPAAALQAGPLDAPPEEAFTIPVPDMIPEGIAYDPVGDAFYVGSTYHRGVWRIGANQSAPRDARAPADATSDEPVVFVQGASHGLWGIVGMRVDADRRLLWLATSHAGDGMPMADMDPALEGSTGLFAFALESGELRHRVILGEPGFLNDVAVASDGAVYVTDSRSGTVYRFTEAAGLEPFVALGEDASPNGLDRTPDGRFLFVAVGRGIVRIDVASGEVLVLERDESTAGTIDGLYVSDGDLVVVQPWPGERYVTRIELDEAMSRIVGERVLLAAHPALDQPTTGAVVGSDIYVIANSHLQTFRRLWSEASDDDLSARAAALSPPTILRVPMTRGGS